MTEKCKKTNPDQNETHCKTHCIEEELGQLGASMEEPSSTYVVACEEGELIEYQKQLLYDVLGPIFFGKKQAENREELEELFLTKYGIDVNKDFCDGDDHYEEYIEARAAITEGMSIYVGKIAFDDCKLAELAGEIWEDMERQDKHKFRRINTMLEE